ncbi:MAG: hypothetical protein CM15mV24_2250 [Bellamyvirus sp.]|nr:MAG: hypothetical protein CM15mV24_2250 [Bellamyvirus sp.]
MISCKGLGLQITLPLAKMLVSLLLHLPETASSTTTDANTSGLPIGGTLLSMGSTEGFGYQPLVSAGATAKVTNVGVLTDVAIGNTGSGYRVAEKVRIPC